MVAPTDDGHDAPEFAIAPGYREGFGTCCSPVLLRGEGARLFCVVLDVQSATALIGIRGMRGRSDETEE